MPLSQCCLLCYPVSVFLQFQSSSERGIADRLQTFQCYEIEGGYTGVIVELCEPRQMPHMGVMWSVEGFCPIVQHAIESGRLTDVVASSWTAACIKLGLAPWRDGRGKAKREGTLMSIMHHYQPDLTRGQKADRYKELTRVSETELAEDIDALAAFSAMDVKAAEEFRNYKIKVRALSLLTLLRDSRKSSTAHNDNNTWAKT